MRVRTQALLLAATFALSGVLSVVSVAPAQAAACAGVWVVVDFGSLGGTSTRCATSYGTGTGALKSAGFSPSLDGAMIMKISGKPGSPDINKAYWSYWHATVKSDGSYSDWSYSNLGGSAYHPAKGNAEGWRYQSLSDGKVAPGASPPKAEPEPTPTPTPTRSSPKPTPKPTKTATVKPTTTASATPKASASTPKARVTTSATPTRSATPTPTPASTPTGSDPAVAQVDSVVAPPEPAPDSGSPVGAIAAGAVVLLGGAGLGGWWMLRGRKR